METRDQLFERLTFRESTFDIGAEWDRYKADNNIIKADYAALRDFRKWLIQKARDEHGLPPVCAAYSMRVEDGKATFVMEGPERAM